eukprot:tig00000113_g5649.t1
MRALEVGGDFEWIGFLPSLSRLEHVTLNLRSEADTAPLAALAPTLRSLVLVQNAQDPAALCSVIRRLCGLQALDLNVPPRCFEQLAAEPLTCWPELEVLQLACYPNEKNSIPAGLLQRLGTDTRALRRLTLGSPLPSDPALLGLASALGPPRWAGLRALILSDAAEDQALLRGRLSLERTCGEVRSSSASGRAGPGLRWAAKA